MKNEYIKPNLKVFILSHEQLMVDISNTEIVAKVKQNIQQNFVKNFL